MVLAVRRTGSSRQPDPRQKKPDDHMWRDCVEGRVVDDDWQNADDATSEIGDDFKLTEVLGCQFRF